MKHIPDENRLRTRKTPMCKRGTYQYSDTDEDMNLMKKTLKPGEDGVTQSMIKQLHAIDDSEVYYNLKAVKPYHSMTKSEKQTYNAMKKAWQEKFIAEFVARNGYEPDNGYVKNELIKAFPSECVISFDGVDVRTKANDKFDPYEFVGEDDVSTQVEICVRESIRKLPKRCQVIYDKVMHDGQSHQSIAEELGVTRVTVENDIRKIISKIRQDKKISKFFR